MKKLFWLFCLSFVFSFAFSQTSLDVNDDFYRQTQIWELQGLTSNLPQLRPYPLNVVEKILNDVIDNGSDSQASLAKEEYERIFSRPWKLYLDPGLSFKLSHEEHDNYSENSSVKDLHASFGIGGDLALHKLVSVGYKLGFYGQKNAFSEYSPLYTRIMNDCVHDPVDVGPFTVYQNWNLLVSVGNESIYGRAGLSRLGYGPFLSDGLAVNDSGYHSANITFNASRKSWSYASAYATIGATRNMGQEVDSNWLSKGKYLSFHAIKWHYFDKFHVSYYENVIFGPQNNLAYFTPAPYMAIQNINGAGDNLQMGLLFEVKPIKGLEWATDFFADDIELNEVFKFNFDTKLRFGFQTGLIYAPEESLCTRLSFNYTAIMPYVYAHWEYDSDEIASFTGRTWNRQNYTNAGINIGSALDPNSDKISLSATLKPKKNLTLNLFGNFIRHANSAEDFSDDEAAEYMLAKSGTYATNGTLYMNQMFSNPNGSGGTHVDSAWNKLGFMTSDHKMYVAQLGFNAEYTFARTRYGRFSLCAGYTFEYVKNNGVNTNLYKGGLMDNITVEYEADEKTFKDYKTPDGKTYSSWEDLKKSEYVRDAVNNARETWVSQLYNSINHYITLSIKYSY
ncbi:hypothetical protein [uncultured Treponema sp.]|uniref:hypothetical protein n=1 Tax=uncultured Treponema sp. TaxID=162155 RepID=UPI002634773B|nr:hypothetical protein [uncultured Treponema sp.]